MAEGKPDGEDGKCTKTDQPCLGVDSAVLIGDAARYEAADC